MTFYTFRTYSGDEYILLSDTDNLTVEEVFRKYLPGEYTCWFERDPKGVFSYGSFCRSYVDTDETIKYTKHGRIELSKMAKEIPYFSDNFQDFLI